MKFIIFYYDVYLVCCCIMNVHMFAERYDYGALKINVMEIVWYCFVTFWFLIYKHVPSINLCEYGIISNVCTFTQPEFCFRFVFLQSDFLRICTYKSAFIFSITCISYVQLLI